MSLEIVYGCMFAGKSTELIARLTRRADFGKKCLYINHSKDIRLSESTDGIVSTHNSGFQKLSKKITGIKVSHINDIDINVDEYDDIGIDEFQFFHDKVEEKSTESIEENTKENIKAKESSDGPEESTKEGKSNDKPKIKYDITIATIRDWVLRLRKRVIIASLDSDFKLNPFGCAHHLIGLCGKGGVVKLTAICVKCENENPNDAPHTMKIAGDDSVLDPGGSDKYIPVCMKCYLIYNKYW